jgi:hypothetical protein
MKLRKHLKFNENNNDGIYFQMLVFVFTNNRTLCIATFIKYLQVRNESFFIKNLAKRKFVQLIRRKHNQLSANVNFFVSNIL